MSVYEIHNSDIYCDFGREEMKKIGQIDLLERGHIIEIHRIFIDEKYRENGHARDVIQLICSHADLRQKVLALTPVSDFGSSKTRLEKFYRSMGFVKNRGRVKEWNTKEGFIRLPFIAL